MTEVERAKEFLMLHWAENGVYLLGDPERLGKFLRAVVEKYSYTYVETGEQFVVVDELLDLVSELENLEE